MKRILILEPDEQAAAELSAAVEGRAACEVLLASNVREACLYVAQQPVDVAFVPLAQADDARRALHMLQPELALAALYEEGEDRRAAPVAQENALRGVYSRAELPQALAQLLSLDEDPSQGEGAGVETRVMEAAGDLPAGGSVNGGAGVQGVLDEAVPADKVVAAIFTSRKEVLARGGSLNDELARAIARRVDTTWHAENSGLIQFMRLPDRSGDLLLFTRPVRGSQLLTLVTAPEVTLTQVRREADQLAKQLSPFAEGRPGPTQQESVVTSHAVQPEPSETVSYALMWKPRRPLPEALRVALGRALKRLAAANACQLRHLMVESGLVHIVVTCPGQRSSAWAAHLFKRGSQAEIQEQFGVPAELWEKGYYAAESETPLSQKELDLFLGTNAQS